MVVHVPRRHSHGFDRFVERHTVYTVACERQLCLYEGKGSISDVVVEERMDTPVTALTAPRLSVE